MTTDRAGSSTSAAELDVEVLIVGAGISGIGAAIELQRHGFTSFALLDAADDLGGTWRDNTYPGIAVDIPCSSYCYSFATDFPWSRLFAPGREILSYLKKCADQYAITGHIRYNAKVIGANFIAERDMWETELRSGDVLRSRYLIAATGLLSQPKLPDIDGLDSFAGKVMHSAHWDHQYEFQGKRCAIIGTGASAVQIVPELADKVAQLSVFQRTPIWVSPRLDMQLQTPSTWNLRRFHSVRLLLRFLSEALIQLLTFAIVHYRSAPFIVDSLQRRVRAWMRSQIDNPKLADQLIPDYLLGCKRPSTSNTYLQCFNRPHVALITQKIQRICPEGLVTDDGKLHAFDVLILATGFLTTEQGNAPSFKVYGDKEKELGQFWEDQRLQAYAGVSLPDFPNFFLTAGPYSGGFNWFAMLEVHLRQIRLCLEQARARGVTRVAIDPVAHARYMQSMWHKAEATVFKSPRCAGSNSYYLDRHGDASLPLPLTPWWRKISCRWSSTRDYIFGRPEKT